MQSAPADLYDALTARLSESRRKEAAKRAIQLKRPLHPHCYIPGAKPPQRAGQSVTPADRQSENDLLNEVMILVIPESTRDVRLNPHRLSELLAMFTLPDGS